MPKARRSAPGSRLPRTAIATTFLAALVTGWVLSLVPLTVLLLYAAMATFTAIAYAFDKSAAQAGRWRTQESTLHLFALLGGWPGALYAQAAYRHKSSKRSFQVAFWLTVAVNCAALAWLIDTGHAAAIDRALLGP